jgi:hypothetical protein
MTTSDKLSRLYAAQEFVEDALRGEIPLSEWDDYKAAVAEALNNAAQEAREVGEEYTSSRDNMPEGLQNAGTGEELEQKAQSCEDWADALESAASSVEGMDAPEPDEPAEGEEADPDPEVPTTEIDDEASNAIGGLEL